MADEHKPNDEIPAGMMRAWDPEQKKVILVSAPPAPGYLTLTVRLHDPRERKDAKLSASWVVIQVPREDLELSAADFAVKHLLPAVEQLEHFKPKQADVVAAVEAPAQSPDLPATSADPASSHLDPAASVPSTPSPSAADSGDSGSTPPTH